MQKIYKIRFYSERNIRNYLLKQMKQELSIFNKYLKIEVSIFNNDNKEITIISSIVNLSINNERYLFAKKASTFLTNTVNKLCLNNFTICYKFESSNFKEYNKYLSSLKIKDTNNKNFLHTKVRKYNNAIIPVVNKIDLTETIKTFISNNKLPDFIYVLVQIQNVEYIYYTIGERYPLEVNNADSVDNYISYLVNKFEILDKNEYNPSLAIAVHIIYCEIDKNTFDYETRVMDLSLFKPIKSFIDKKVIPLPKFVSALPQAEQRQLRREQFVVCFIAGPMLTYSLLLSRSAFLSSTDHKGFSYYYNKYKEFFPYYRSSQEIMSNVTAASIEAVSSSGSDSDIVTSSSSEISKSLSLFLFRGKNKYRLLVILFIIIIIGSISIFFNFNILKLILNIIYNPNPIYIKYIMLIFTIVNFILILRYIIFIVLIYLIRNNKIKLSKSNFKPSFVNNFIDKFQILSNSEHLEIIIDYYYKHMYIFIFLFLFTMFLYFIF